MASPENDHILVAGYDGCGYYARAVEAAKSAHNVQFTAKVLPTRKAFLDYLSLPSVRNKIGNHKTSPVVFHNTDGMMGDVPTSTSTFLGGCDSLLEWLSVAPDLFTTLSPSEILEFFHKQHREFGFVVWVLFRGLW